MTDYVDSRRAMLKRNGFAMSKTFGTSMRPLIWGGRHCVAVAPLDGEPQVGDLLMFVKRGDGRERNVVHRLVEVTGEGEGRTYFTRGDNCLARERVGRGDIIGRVVEVHRIGGWRPWYAIPGRQFAVTDRAYIRYTRIWASTWPLRRLCYLLRARAHALARRLAIMIHRLVVMHHGASL